MSSQPLGTSPPTIADPYKAGTNEFLMSVGWKHAEINDQVSLYGKDVLKSASRIAYDLMSRKGYSSDVVDSLLNPVREFGYEAVRHLTLEDSYQPADLQEHFTTAKHNGVSAVYPVLTFQRPLEVIILGDTRKGDKTKKRADFTRSTFVAKYKA